MPGPAAVTVTVTGGASQHLEPCRVPTFDIEGLTFDIGHDDITTRILQLELGTFDIERY
jgi:hypothetical protein